MGPNVQPLFAACRSLHSCCVRPTCLREKQRVKTSEMTDQENVQRQSQNPVGFGAYKSPIQISYIGAIRGHAAPALSEPFTYLEIGCDRGVGLAMLADCYPNGRFIAFEEDEDNVAAACDLAAKSDLSNMEVVQGTLEDDAFQSLPEFNFIGIGGAYSWLSPKAREGFAKLIKEKLLPGGMVYLAYTAMPGAVQTDTFYKFIRLLTKNSGAATDAQLRNVVGKFAQLQAAGATYFQAHPTISGLVQNLGRVDPSRLLSEAEKAQWGSPYFGDVYAQMSEIGLTYAGAANIDANYPELSAPANVRGLITAEKDVVARETYLDMARNSAARFDIYVKAQGGGDKASVDFSQFYVDRPNEGQNTVARQRLAQQSGVNFMEAIYSDVLEKLEGTSACLQDILEADDLKKYARSSIIKAIELLVATSQVNMLARPPKPAPGNLSGAFRLPSKLNNELLALYRFNVEPLPISSPVAGTQFLLSLSDRLVLSLFLGEDPAFLWKELQSRKIKMDASEKPISTEEEFRQVMQANQQSFRERAVPALTKLGVIEPA